MLRWDEKKSTGELENMRTQASVTKDPHAEMRYALRLIADVPKPPTLSQWRQMKLNERYHAIHAYTANVLNKLRDHVSHDIVEDLADPEKTVAQMLDDADCTDAAEAAEAFATIHAVMTDQGHLIQNAKALAQRWYSQATQDVIVEQLRIAAASLGRAGSQRTISAFPNCAARDNRQCPLRAGEQAAALAIFVGVFLATTDPDRHPRS